VSYNFEATKDFQNSLVDIDTLLDFAEKENTVNNASNRMLFLKLSIVSMVTKFQVYIEKVLGEFLFQVRNSRKKNKELPLHSRLNSIKLISTEYILSKQLMDPEVYNEAKYKEVNDHVVILNRHCDQEGVICEEYCLNIKFPMGKTGVNELLNLFKQFEGKGNIFEAYSIDIEKLNGILNIRHNIIHQDANPSPLTEVLVKDYMEYFKSLVVCIDNYLNNLPH
jgi:hypothetical protein